jgi:glutathione S-transferase
MLLYDNRHAPSPRRVRIFLKEKDIEVPTAPVDLLEGGNLMPDFQRVSPRGLLPVLRLDDGTIIDETDAICRYFEELKPEPSLFGLTAVEKALVASWSRRAEFDGMAGAADVFRNSVPPMANRGVPGRTGDPQIPQLVERGKITVARFYQMLDDRLAGARYLAGDRFSIADITALCTIDFSTFAGMTIPDDHANVRRWHKDVSVRPSMDA